MRYLVYLLVIANLAFFAWYQANPVEKPRQAQPAPLPPGVEKLVLLSERTAAVADTAVDEPQETVAQADAGAVEPGVEAVPDIKVEPEAEPEPEAESPAPVIPAPPPERICLTIGPVQDKNAAAGICAQLYKHGYKPEVRDDEVRKPAGFWVYMPSMPAREAKRIVKDLDQHGMKDYFIGKGSHISLGIFKSKRKARARLKRIKDLGYTAKLDLRFRTRTVYWLVIEEHGPSLPDRAFWQEIQARYPDIGVQPGECE